VPDLQYEPTAAARPVHVERDGRVTRVVVAMRGPYAPVPKWVFDSDLLAMVAVPLWWVGSFVAGRLLRRRKPPRAVFEVEGDQFRMALRDATTGEVATLHFPRDAVVEVRANRFERGLWLHVEGLVKDTFLSDLPRDTIERLAAALAEALSGANSDAGTSGTRGFPNRG
jgi:hypothetical protein